MKVVFQAGRGVTELFISIQGRRITVEGFLGVGADFRECVDQALRYVANRYQVLAYEGGNLAPVANRPLWTVDASRCVVVSGGAEYWVNSMNHKMAFTRVYYEKSQLADVVRGHPKYRHSESTFVK